MAQPSTLLWLDSSTALLEDLLAIFKLRNGLGEDDEVPQPIADAQIRVVCEWSIQSGWRLWQLSPLNSRLAEPIGYRLW